MMTALIRKAALTAVGAAFVGGALAGPATAMAAPAPNAVKATSVSADRKAGGERELNIRYEAQPNFFYCGPAATRNALTALDKDLSQDDLARQMGTTEAGTDSAVDITRALNKQTREGTYRTIEISAPRADDAQTDKLREDVVKAVDSGRAVVANIAGTATDTDGGTHSFEGGHYLSVVGYRDNGDTVKIADSANPDQASYWMTTEAMADWIATRGYSA
ncbi:C39 family peptidase [Micromonospora phytophila]|uniref:C39 family peptidase n=1 Tax=Micromonospora phytophila TaxID=709888 RepID=UPI00202E4A60|nr:C39 family peptidase [Micromonospora phytophila]MCM0675499.1 C39 family peptidase [Micromonospora phytophila]